MCSRSISFLPPLSQPSSPVHFPGESLLERRNTSLTKVNPSFGVLTLTQDHPKGVGSGWDLLILIIYILIKPFSDPYIRGHAIIEETTNPRRGGLPKPRPQNPASEMPLTAWQKNPQGQAFRPVPFSWWSPHVHSPTRWEYSGGWLKRPFSTSLQTTVFTPVNSQMCIHVCNEGFMHCNPAIIFLGLHPALTFSVTCRRVALLFSLPYHTNAQAACNQMCAVNHHFRSYLLIFPVDLNSSLLQTQ